MAATSGAAGADPSIGYCARLRRELSGEPDVGNLHLRFDEGRGTFPVPSYSTGSVREFTFSFRAVTEGSGSRQTTKGDRLSYWLLHCPGEFRGCSLNHLACVLQDLAHFGDLFVGQFPILLFDAFTHGGERLDSVAGIEAGRIDLVLEPW